MAVDPSPRALITVEEAADLIRELTLNGNTDTVQTLVNQASELCHEYTKREFVWKGAAFTGDGTTPIEQTESVRRFDVPGWHRGRVFEIGDASEVTAVSLNDSVVDASEWLALPLFEREPWEPFTQIRFESLSFTWAPVSTPLAKLEVTAVWGFPIVPERVKRACQVMVEADWQRDIQQTSDSYDEEVAGVGFASTALRDRTFAMPFKARQLLDQFRAVTV